MFHPPLLGYSGISVILSRRGRHDNERLLTARGGEYFDQCLTLASKQLGLQIPVTRFNLFIKELADPQPLPPETKVVLLLDSKAQRCFIPDLTLNEARGYCYQLPNSQEVYIASYSPEEAMDRKFIYSGAEDEDGEDDDDPEAGKEKDHSPTRRKNWKYWLCQDIKKTLDISVNGYKPLLKLAKFQIYLPSTEVIHKLNSITNEHFYFDIETDPFFRVTVFSFSTDCDTIWTVPLIRYDGSEAYDRLQILRILVALAGVFTRNTVVIHNCLFDLLILLWRYKIPPPLDWRRIKDTMVLQHRLQPEVEKSLGHCGSYLTHEEYHKNQIIYVPKSRDQEQRLWLYNARDVGMLAIIYPKLQKLGEHKGAQGSFDRAHRLLLPYLLQTVFGCNVDLSYKSKTFDELERKKAQYQRMAKFLCGYDIEKLGSWQRVAKYLYEYKGLPKPAPKFVDGVFKYEELTASATLYKLRSQYNIPLIDLLLHYRADGKESGFLKFNCWTPLVDQHRGIHNPTRFTSSDSITGTNTLRNASRMLFDFWGSNKQNVKKKLRAVVIADPGKDLVQTDQAGAEALVVAYLAPRGQYRALFENGIKSHVFVAMHVFQKEWEVLMEQPLTDFINSPINKLTKVPGWKKLEKFIKDSDNWIASKRYYYIAKMICHASNYGMKGPTFQINVLKKSEGKIIISKKEADFFLGTYHYLFPEIRLWHSKVQQQLQTQGKILTNLFGDQREFMGQWDDTLFKEAYAFVPQSTVGMLTNIAIGELQEKIDKNEDNIRCLGVDILANGHDAILSQCWQGCGEYLAKEQEKLLAKTFFEGTPNQFTMKSESSIGPRWDFKSYNVFAGNSET